MKTKRKKSNKYCGCFGKTRNDPTNIKFKEENKNVTIKIDPIKMGAKSKI